jgi:hypothetical protein
MTPQEHALDSYLQFVKTNRHWNHIDINKDVIMLLKHAFGRGVNFGASQEVARNIAYHRTINDAAY